MEVSKIYNGKTYTFDVGTYENNRMPIRIGFGHVSQREQPQRAIVRRIVIDLDDEGNPAQVITTLEHQEFFNNGTISRGTCFTEEYRMADAELPQFAARFGQGIRISAYNMFARGGKPGQQIALGQNVNPVFDSATGDFKPEEVTTEPTHDYPHEPV